MDDTELGSSCGSQATGSRPSSSSTGAAPPAAAARGPLAAIADVEAALAKLEAHADPDPP